jgi:nitrogenase molybdenum-iron protein alpha/beta subunit
MSVAPPDHSQRVMRSYMVGVYLAVNAVRDAYLLVEGPDCAHMKTQFVQGNHDWLSTLTSVSGYHRVANTALHPVHMARSREDDLRRLLSRLAGHPATGGVLLTSMPMAFVTGADYQRLCREAAETTGKAVVHIPGKSLSGDWLDGYAESLLALAQQLPLDCAPGRPADPRKVAVVGYLFDRNEGDHRANVRDLREILAALGLETVSVWLEGQSFADLGAVARAGTILSFPYGRRAARALARRTGARVIECELPFGLDATERLVTQLGEALGVEEAARRLIDRELAEVIPALEWVIPFVFQGRSLGFIGDPYMACGAKESAALLGARLAFAVITDPPAHCRDLGARLGPEVRLLIWPKHTNLRRFLEEVIEKESVDLLVTNQHGVGMGDVAWVELGFPSVYSHALYDRPFLGFRGALAFFDTLANAARRFEVDQALASRGHGKGSGHTR